MMTQKKSRYSMARNDRYRVIHSRPDERHCHMTRRFDYPTTGAADNCKNKDYRKVLPGSLLVEFPSYC
jgi:hypothetical protein